MANETGGPAFPIDYETAIETEAEGSAMYGTGMTLRDYFAAKAMQGMLSNGFIPHMVKPDGSVLQQYNYAEIAYSMADAMLKARG